MNQSKRENFHTKLADTPPAVRVFFLSILLHFEQDPATIVHYTLTNGGDLRLAVSPPTKSSKTRMRNFATLYWQSRNRVLLARMYLTPVELAVLDFQSSTAPTSAAEPLLNEIRLSEQECRTVSPKAISALEQAKIKMVDTF